MFIHPLWRRKESKGEEEESENRPLAFWLEEPNQHEIVSLKNGKL